LLRNALVPALVKRYFADAPRPAGPAFEKTPAAALEGSYMTTRRSDVSWMRLQGLLGQVVVRARADGALEARGLTDAAGNPERFREVAPGSFRSGDGEREIAFVRDAAGRAIELQPWFPGLTYERARFWDTQDVALAVFAPAAAIALGVLLAPLVGALARRALGAPPAPPRGLGARWLGRATAAAWLAGLGGFAAFGADAAQNVWRFSEREDAPLAAAIFAIWGAAVLSVACAATTARELRAARALTPARRFARALPALAFLALTWFAWNWALLSNPARY
jgi:hypothetical protein